MNTQINVRLPNNLLESAQEFAKDKGYKNVQELIKDALREKLSLEFSKQNNPHVR
jgi:metal-responsive CopG/Arc/MetJ family transcriptional regulator